MLIREIQHRVKNNLQVVSSLMSLQARKAPAALKPFIQESLERIGAMGRVHEQLYRSDDASTYGAHVLIQTICRTSVRSMAADGDRVTCRAEAPQPVQLPVDVATRWR